MNPVPFEDLVVVPLEDLVVGQFYYIKVHHLEGNVTGELMAKYAGTEPWFWQEEVDLLVFDLMLSNSFIL